MLASLSRLACRVKYVPSIKASCLSHSIIKSSRILTHSRGLHFGNDDAPVKTIREVVQSLTAKVGAAKSFTQAVDRTSLLELLPASQDELPPRSMKDSWDSAIIPLGSEERLREKYLTFLGGVRVGRLLEDLDVFAVWLCYKHVLNPRQKEDLPSPYSIVTALVDRIDFNQSATLRPDRDIRLSGHVSWAGRSSMETVISIEQYNEGKWMQVTRAVFVMVARDPLNQGSAIINRLIPETGEERKLYQAGEIHKLHRQQIKEESLFRVPPNETEKTLVYDMFMTMANPKELSFAIKNKPENSVWMEESKLKNLIICHPEHRNRFKKVFGGFIMRQAFEIGWACAFTHRCSLQRNSEVTFDTQLRQRPLTSNGDKGSHWLGCQQNVITQSRNIFYKIFGGFLMREAFEFSWVNASLFSKQRPRILHIDDIIFRRPVEIGSLLYLSSQVVYSNDNHIQISTKASVMDPATESISLTNIFHFTFQVEQPVPRTLPRTYDEALMYLDGRRHYQLVRGLRKFYGQGEMPSDTLI